jgi:hypothetical protein
MAITLQNLLSKVQRIIGDEGFVRVKRAELVDVIEDATSKIADDVRLWIEQITILPRSLTETFTVNTYNDLAALTPTLYDTAFVLDETQRYRYYNNAWEIHPYNVVKIDPGTTQVYQTIQIWKNGVQCNEQSLQSVNQGYASGFFYSGTNAVEPVSLGIEYANYRRSDDGSNFIFSRDFESSDVVTIIYRKEKPIMPVLWTSSISIPDPVVSAIQWQAVQMIQTSLYMQGDEAAQGKSMYAKQIADTELRNANAYLRNLLNENSRITIQPLRWLPE